MKTLSPLDAYELGNQIRQKREELKLTREKLSEQANISVVFLSELERGNRLPSARTLRALCYCLQLSADKILGLQEIIEDKKENNDEK